MKRGNVSLISAVLFSIILFSSFVSAINTCATGYQVVKDRSAIISCYDTSCTAGSKVSYSGSASGLFVPTKTQAEWNAFKAVYSKISGTSYACTCTQKCYCNYPMGSSCGESIDVGHRVERKCVYSDCTTQTTTIAFCVSDGGSSSGTHWSPKYFSCNY